MAHQENDTNRVMVALSLLCWSIYINAFAILTIFVLSHANSTQHPQTSHPASPLFFKTFHPASTRYYTHWKLSFSSHPGSAVQLHTYSCVFKKYLRTPKQYSSTQQRILAWTNSSRRARRHAWCWVELYPHHCLRGECWNQSLFAPLWSTRTNGWHVILLYI